MSRPACIRTTAPLIALVAATLLALASSEPSVAATPSPGWTISSSAEPSNFPAADDAACEAASKGVPPSSSPCDSYRVLARNVGSRPSSAPLTVIDTLPSGAGVEAVYAVLEEHQPGGSAAKTNCTLAPVRCEYTAPVASGGELIVTVNVTVSASAGPSVLNSARLEGADLAAPLGTSEPTTTANAVNAATPPFTLEGFDFGVDGVDGAADQQAGGHPFAVTSSVRIPSVTRFAPEGGTVPYQKVPVQRIKDLLVGLPPGLVGDSQASAHCPLSALKENYAGAETATNCPAASRIGTATIESQGIFDSSNDRSETSSIFNMVPEAGYPAEFGISYLGNPVILYASLLPTASGYVTQVSVGGLLDLPLQGLSLTFFGDPGSQDGLGAPSTAFLTNQTNCSGGAGRARIEADSWEEPQRWVSAEASAYPGIVGCELLEFSPTLAVAPTETTQADTPSGYEVDLKVAQSAGLSSELASPELRNAQISLPEGVSLSPGGAEGLLGCEDSGPEGINIAQGWSPRGSEPLDPADPDATEVGPDGLPRIAGGHCPGASQLGTVEIATPLLPAPLQGHIYLAQPRCGGAGQAACTPASAADGELFGLYLEAAGSGVILKLRGTALVDPVTGAISVRFDEDPQLPFSELRLRLKGGPQAALANPLSCGEARTTSVLEPWSAPQSGAPATPLSSFGVSGCGADTPFDPSFSAGSASSAAGAFSPFTLTLARSDGQQYLSQLSASTPPGLLAALSTVQPCLEPQASQGDCGAGSEVGHSEVAAGAGTAPHWASGQAFLTGPYDGAPFGLSIVTPVQVGPFDLGSVVVRVAVRVDPQTAALTFTSDALPQILDGVPLRIQTLSVTIDRPGFTFNPTRCAPMAIKASLQGAGGAVEPVPFPFQATGCAGLPFAPALTASVAGHATKADGASLRVRIDSPASGAANVQKLQLTLPKALPSRLTTIQRACAFAVFSSNPGACPPASDIGSVSVHTPILRAALSGPAYLVSRGGDAFPQLELVLQGEGLLLNLSGTLQIRKGTTRLVFESLPDAPFTSLEALFPSGPNSALTSDVPARAHFSLCGTGLSMPAKLTGQNGAEVQHSAKIAVTGCSGVKGSKVTKLSREQMLTRSLKACRRKRSMRRRAVCAKQARARYARGKRAGKR
jgi:hypothetical protein